MIAFVHGYLLEGSGSCLWTRSILTAMCRDGHTVHLICQEAHPDRYDFIAEAYKYHHDGTVEKYLEKEVPYKGKVIMHKPQLGDLLPVYVRDKYEEYKEVVPMIELEDKELNKYIDRNYDVLKQILQKHDIDVVLVNHTVLISVPVEKASKEAGIPFVVVPHGSCIEYAVKKDERFLHYGEDVMKSADAVFHYNAELDERLKNLFPSISGIMEKTKRYHLGVDTTAFKVIDKSEIRGNIEKLKESLKNDPRGKSAEDSALFEEMMYEGIEKEEFIKIMKKTSDYDGKATDKDFEKRLEQINWEKEKVMLFVGRLILIKGAHCIIAGLPEILEKEPDTKVIMAGHGGLREILEAWLWAFQHSDEKLINNILDWAVEMEGENEKTIAPVKLYFEQLKAEGKWDDYLKKAAKYLTKDRIIFTGYLTHKDLKHLFPCCDIAIFPSLVKEAGPLVLFEAAASGCFPMGTYFGGMQTSINSVSMKVSEKDKEFMKIRFEDDKIVTDIINNCVNALKISDKYRKELNEAAVANHDWQNIARAMFTDLTELSKKKVKVS